MGEFIFVNEKTDRFELAARTIAAIGSGSSVQWVGARRVAGLIQSAGKIVARHVPAETVSIGTEKYPEVIAEETGLDGPDQAEIIWYVRGDDDVGSYWAR